MEEKRRLMYEALLMQASGRWATVEEIEEMADQQNMEPVLDGLVHMRELERNQFDDGIKCYRLTEFGSRFASISIYG